MKINMNICDAEQNLLPALSDDQPIIIKNYSFS